MTQPINNQSSGEPALIIGFIGSVLTTLATLNVSWLPASAVAVILSLLTAAATAFFTRPVAPSLYAGVVAAAAAVLAQYGFHVPDAAVAGISGIILAGFALFGIRNQVSPTSEVKSARGRTIVR
jgi:hypothetical protein